MTEPMAEVMLAEAAESVAEERAPLRDESSAPADELMFPRTEEISPAMEEAAPEALLRAPEASEAMALETEATKELASEAPGTAGVVGVGTGSWAWKGD